MPVMDGYTFLDIIKKDAVLSLIPVIVATQSDSEQDEITALEHGATDFVPKPYRPQIIRHRAASLIKLRESAAMVNQFKFDRLTGLYSKEFFYRTVKELLQKEPEKEYTLLCCNIENFRLYNDTFGRKAGDKLFKEAACIFRKRVSESSVCCRYTADSFLCLTDKESELMELEGDLGVDSIQKVEIFSILDEKFGNVFDQERIGELAELIKISDVADYIGRMLSDYRSEEQEPVQSETAEGSASDKADIKQVIVKAVSEITGFPAEMIESDMDLESDLGVDSI